MTPVFSCWPMYDLPRVQFAWDALWGATRDALRARGIEAPDALTRQLAPMDSWAAHNLLIGQICNLPYRALYRGQAAGHGLSALGCLDHGIEGCLPGYYRSVIIVQEDDPATCPAQVQGYALAYNEPLSHSGWGAVWSWAQTHGVQLCPTQRTGAHALSLAALQNGRAQIASVDILTWRYADPAQRAGLRVLDYSAPAPGMTYITRAPDPAPIRAALAQAVDALPEAPRAALGLRGFAPLPDLAYDFPLPPRPQEAS